MKNRNKSIQLRKTVVQCDCCEKKIISPLEILPEKCPYCKSLALFSFSSLSEEDSNKLFEYVTKS